MITIDGATIRRIIDMPAAIARVGEALRAVEAGLFSVPQRAVAGDGRALAMVATRSDDPGIVWKVLSSNPANAAQGLPTLHSTVLWADDETGAMSALMDGEEITELRTGAVAGLATDLLAVPDAAVFGLLGAGAQAADQVRAACAVRPIRRVRVWSRSAGSAQALIARIAPEFPEVSFEAVSDAASAVRGADVVTAATRATEPLIHAADLAPHALVNAIGAFRPDMIEVAPDVFAAADIVTADGPGAVRAEAGDIVRALAEGALAGDDIRALASVDAVVPGTGIRVFKSVGTGVLDWALAAAVFRAQGQVRA